MKVSLLWNGPVGPGRFPSDPVALQDMFQPGVYLRVKRYDRDRVVSYVGQSKSVLTRIDQHITQLLGLQHVLRDSTGQVWMRGDFESRLHCYRDIATSAQMAAEEAARMSFYWAHCDETFHVEHLGVAEAALKGRLEDLAAAENALASVENQQGIPVGSLDEPVSIDNDVSALDDPDRRLLVRLLGTEPIVYDDDPETQASDA